MQRNRYAKDFKDQALSKARQRGSRTLESIATELNIRSALTLDSDRYPAERLVAGAAASGHTEFLA